MMNKNKKRKVRFIGKAMLTLGFFATILLTVSAGERRQMDTKTVEKLQKKGVPISSQLIEHDDGEIYLVKVEKSQFDTAILFIHGSPGNWSGWKDYLANQRLFDRFLLLAYDRPGYGGTSIKVTPSLKKQSDCVVSIIKEYPEVKNWIVVGHSYGGSVMAYLLGHHSDLIDKMVFLAPAVSPEHQQPKWYNKWAKRKLVKSFIGGKMKTSNIEMLGLHEELALNEPSIRNSKEVPVQYFIHGEKDMIVSFKSAAYWQSLGMDSVHYFLKRKMNHFVPWSDPELVYKAILSK